MRILSFKSFAPTAAGLALILLGNAAPAASQVCLGRPALGEVGSFNLGAQLDLAPTVNAYGADAYGGSKVFGGVSVATLTYDQIDDNSLVLGATVGGALPIEGALSVCPYLSASRNSGLEVLGIEATTITLAPGLAAGTTVALSPGLDLVPAAKIAAVYGRTTLSAEGFESESESDVYGMLTLGSALSFGGTINVGPYLAIPFGLEESDTVFSISASFAVGGRQ